LLIPALHAQANIRFVGTAAPSGAEITLGLNHELYTGDARDAAQSVLVNFQSTAIRALINTALTIQMCEVKFGPNATGQAGIYSNPLGGTAGSTAVSPAVSMLIRKQTGFGGRTGRGRMYFPGAGEPNVDAGGNVLSAHVAAWNSALEAMRSVLISLGLVPTLLHGAGSPVQVPMPITSFGTDNRVATQRRRLRG